MNAQALATEYLDTLDLSGLSLELAAESQLREKASEYTRLIQQAWPIFKDLATQENLWSVLGIQPERQTLEIELSWVGLDTMHALNKEYRDKDSATDVLTFTLLADHPDPTSWLQLPVMQLGSVFVCLDWAEAEVQKDPKLNLARYILERVIHGFLHLLGVHHDTMEQFERVVRLQKTVLDAVFEQNDINLETTSQNPIMEP